MESTSVLLLSTCQTAVTNAKLHSTTIRAKCHSIPANVGQCRYICLWSRNLLLNLTVSWGSCFRLKMPDRDRERDGCIGLFASYLLAFIVLVIGFSCPYWIWDKSEGAEYHTGLWRSCTVDADDDMDCKSIDLSEQEG